MEKEGLPRLLGDVRLPVFQILKGGGLGGGAGGFLSEREDICGADLLDDPMEFAVGKLRVRDDIREQLADDQP